MRLTDADTLYDGAMKDEYFRFKEKDRSGREAFAYSCAMQRLVEAPTIEAEPIKQGKWLPHSIYKDWRICSACRQGTEIVRHEAGATTEYCYQYCPWCGAKMER